MAYDCVNIMCKGFSYEKLCIQMQQKSQSSLAKWRPGSKAREVAERFFEATISNCYRRGRKFPSNLDVHPKKS